MSNRVYIDFMIEISMEINEERKQDLMEHISETIRSLMNNKDIISSSISINTNDEESVLLEMILRTDPIEC